VPAIAVKLKLWVNYNNFKLNEFLIYIIKIINLYGEILNLKIIIYLFRNLWN